MNKSLFLFALLILLASNGICQNITADTTQATIFYKKAFILSNNLKRDSSVLVFQKTSKIYLNLSKKYKAIEKYCIGNYLDCQNQLAYDISTFGKSDTALLILENAANIAKQNFGESSIYLADNYLSTGDIWKDKRNINKSLENYLKAEEFYNKLNKGKILKTANLLYNIGMDYYYIADFKKSLKYFFKSLEIRKELLGEKNIDVAALYNNIGNVYRNNSEYDKALEYLYKSLEIRKELFGEKNNNVAASYNNIGNTYSNKAEYDKSLEYFFKSLKIYSELFGEKYVEVAKLYNNIGISYVNKAEYNKALEYFYKSLELRIELFGEKNKDIADSYACIGIAYYNKAEYNKALEYHFKSLEIYRDLLGEKHLYISMSYNNIGNTYSEKGEYDRALEYYLKSLEIEKDLLGEKHINVAMSYNNIGNVFGNNADNDKALEYLFKSLEILKELLGKKHTYLSMTYNSIGNIYLNENKYEKALTFFHIGMISSLRDSNDTNNINTLPIIKNYLDFNFLLKNMQSKASIFANKLSDLKTALKYYQACDTLIDQTRKKISQTSDKIELGSIAHQVYSGAIATCLKMGSTVELTNSQYYNELAFTYSEKNKGMVLLEALAGQESLKFAGIPDSLLEQEHNLKTDITFYEKQLAEIPDSSTEVLFRNKLFDANRSYEILISNFEKNYLDYYNLKYSLKNPSVKDIQNLLDKQTALRSFLVGDSVIYIFTITKKELNVVQVPKMEHFDDSLKYFRYGLTFTSPRMKEYYRRLGYSFYKLLFPDILDKNIQHIIIVPDGNLGIIPFESLLTTDYSGDIDNYKDYPYLIKKYNISYSYSANLFAKTFSKDKTKNVEFTNLNDWLAFAPVFSDENKSGTALISRELRNAINKSTDDSLMTRSTLISGEYINPLPGTEQETQNIFNLFNQKNKKAQLLLYDKANENYLKSGKLNQFRIIHFATHGFVNSEKPELSGIILNQDTTGGEDGILYSGELYNLKMNADLVVLSACETGLGKIRKGEGIIGLTRALLYAGAKNIVVSLWQVSDRSTSDLMIDFYKNITENEKQNHSKSLQQAKLKMINESKYAHPFYWSPFILIGK